jgi:hypothetical protein
MREGRGGKARDSVCHCLLLMTSPPELAPCSHKATEPGSTILSLIAADWAAGDRLEVTESGAASDMAAGRIGAPGPSRRIYLPLPGQNAILAAGTGTGTPAAA